MIQANNQFETHSIYSSSNVFHSTQFYTAQPLACRNITDIVRSAVYVIVIYSVGGSKSMHTWTADYGRHFEMEETEQPRGF